MQAAIRSLSSYIVNILTIRHPESGYDSCEPGGKVQVQKLTFGRSDWH